MTDDAWASDARSVGIFLNGRGIPDRDLLGGRIVDDSFLLLVNAHYEAMTFTLPDESYGRLWEVVIDTADPLLANVAEPSGPGEKVEVTDRSMQVLGCRY